MEDTLAYGSEQQYLPLKKTKSDLFELLSKKPLIPNKKEISQNTRSRSAKLRYAIRNNNSFFYPEEFKKNFENYFKIEETRLWVWIQRDG